MGTGKLSGIGDEAAATCETAFTQRRKRERERAYCVALSQGSQS